MKKFARLFKIKTRFEVYVVTYALAQGAIKRGMDYLVLYPGYGGKLLFFAATGAVFMAGAKMLQAVEYHESVGLD
jgi:hypothetical protein